MKTFFTLYYQRTVPLAYLFFSLVFCSHSSAQCINDESPLVDNAIGWASYANFDAYTVNDLLTVFGNSVAISGDYAIVGRPKSNTVNIASALIFKRDGNSWTLESTITEPSISFSTLTKFGEAVAIDDNHAIISGDSEVGGVAFIYSRSGTSWTLDATVRDESIDPLTGFVQGGPGDGFAIDVDIKGDYAIVGRPSEGSFLEFGFNAEAAFIYKKDGSNWNLQTELRHPDITESGEEYRQGTVFGMSVAINEDYAVVGAFFETEGSIRPGAAFVFRNDATGWIYDSELLASDFEDGDQFGRTLDISDSGTDIIVSAPREVSDGIEAGAVYFFQLNGSTWTESQKVLASNIQTGDRFGIKVVINDQKAVITSLTENYIFTKNGNVWIEEDIIQTGDVALDGNDIITINTDGVNFYTQVLSEYVSECSATPPAPTALDVCGNTILGSSSTTFPISDSDTTDLFWSFIDDNGNKSFAIQKVIVTGPGGGPIENCTACNLTTYDISNFESGFGIWNDGGSDCARIFDFNLASSGHWAVKLRDNSGARSAMSTDVLDLSGDDKVGFSFDYRTFSFENGEDFILEVSTDGGTSYQALQTWVAGVDFQNVHKQSVNLQYENLSLTATTVFRLRADASDNHDILIIDNVELLTCEDLNSDPDACEGALVTNDDFETGWGTWNDGGSDASLQFTNLLDGLGAVRLRDNSGAHSSMVSDAIDLANNTSVDVSFKFKTISFDDAHEDFFFEMKKDENSPWETLGHWAFGTDFQNNTIYDISESYTGLTFSSNTKFRFRCDASSNGDILLIDEVEIHKGCDDAPFVMPELEEPITVSRSRDDEEIELELSVYPNPAQDFIMISMDEEIHESMNLIISDLSGRQMIEKDISTLDSGSLRVDVSSFNTGMYLVQIYIENQSPIIRRISINR